MFSAHYKLLPSDLRDVQQLHAIITHAGLDPRIPKKVMDKLVRVQRRFLWGGGSDNNKIAWIKWETVCLPKEKGGLGIKDINMFNLALLGKWRWNMFHNEGQLWVRILESKYGGWRGLDVATNDKKQSLWWRDLKSVFRTSQQGEELKRGIKWRIGCGDRIKFWEDEWIEGEAALGAKYPRLSLISCQQNQLIQHMGDYKEAGWEWKLAWRRPLFDNEVLMAANFLNDIERQPIQMHRRDGWLWRGDPSGHYTAQSAYKLLREASAEGIHDTAYHELWKLKVPLKYAIFGWRLIRDRLPTKINLHRRQVAVSDTSCPLCRNEVEDAGHLFFHCRKVTPLWWESMSWVSQFHVFPKDPKMHFLQHALTTTSGSRARRWKWWWIAVTWTIWKQRNKIIFSNEDFDSNKVMDDSVFCFGHG